eukprot:TRINITY_DN3251_c0_g2_i1.p1 TRINITY_DN3251_c0_g2~~TRINITY_DN3251_c0_g2_i1.p1  ORF type:complete len:264 (-),score=54.01 TRINITY_DN3251_c0_g2_i1:1-792(-)
MIIIDSIPYGVFRDAIKAGRYNDTFKKIFPSTNQMRCNCPGTDTTLTSPISKLLSIPKKKNVENTPIETSEPDDNPKLPEREYYILSQKQLKDNLFPMEEDNENYATLPESDEIDSRMFAIDCEMCLTTKGSELTRISIVDEEHNCIYDELVLPRNRITDYLTPYSGITPKLLEGVVKRLEDVQLDLQNLFTNSSILVGHSLENDLRALKIIHNRIIDTSIIYPLNVPRRKFSLKRLTSELLNESIQVFNSLAIFSNISERKP